MELEYILARVADYHREVDEIARVQLAREIVRNASHTEPDPGPDPVVRPHPYASRLADDPRITGWRPF